MIFEILLLIAIELISWIGKAISFVIPDLWVDFVYGLVLDFYETAVSIFTHFLSDYAITAVGTFITLFLTMWILRWILKLIKKITEYMPT